MFQPASDGRPRLREAVARPPLNQGRIVLTPGGAATVINTNIAGNHATTSNDDESTTVSP
jgi:hypothetical protein